MNSVGFVAILVILCATICTGKNMYDDIDVHGSEGKSIEITIIRFNLYFGNANADDGNSHPPFR